MSRALKRLSSNGQLRRTVRQQCHSTIQQCHITAKSNSVTVQSNSLTVQSNSVTVQSNSVTSQQNPTVSQHNPTLTTQFPLAKQSLARSSEHFWIPHDCTDVQIGETPVISGKRHYIKAAITYISKAFTATFVPWLTARLWTLLNGFYHYAHDPTLTYVVPVAVNCSYCTADDGYGKYRNM
jgi:phenylalanyl-tRNA synthetase alpha subunit